MRILFGISSLVLSLATTAHGFVPHHQLHHNTKPSTAFTTPAPLTTKKSHTHYKTRALQASFLDNFFNKPSKSAAVKESKIPQVVVEPDFTLAGVTALLGVVTIYLNPGTTCPEDYLLCPPTLFGGIAGGFLVLFGAFVARQASNIRFVFADNSFNLMRLNDTYDLETSGNIVVGGKNSWSYKTFVNWEFFPSKGFPILVYFKETQTPSDKWDVGPGQFDKVGKGQVHFFPVIAKVKTLDEQFKLRGCAKLEK